MTMSEMQFGCYQTHLYVFVCALCEGFYLQLVFEAFSITANQKYVCRAHEHNDKLKVFKWVITRLTMLTTSGVFVQCGSVNNVKWFFAKILRYILNIVKILKNIEKYFSLIILIILRDNLGPI